MNDATKLRIRRELAERMGYFVEIRWRHATNNKWVMYDLRLPGGIYAGSHSASEDEAWTLAPDPFTSPADCAALVEWLAANDYKSAFGDELLKATGIRDRFLGDRFPAEFHITDLLTSPLETRVLAACEALGIGTEDE